MSERPNAFVTHTLDRTRSLEGTPLASFSRRAWAWLIDFTIVASIALLWRVWLGDGQGSFSPFSSLSGLILIVAYFGLTTYWGHGQTPGKKLLGIQVISISHEHLSLWHCIERALGYAASMLEAGFGFWQYFIHHNRQTVHDRIAETIVIRKSKAPAAPVQADPAA